MMGLLLVAGGAGVAQTVRIAGNPILSDGRYHSADPAPVVDGDTLYILAGRDEAPEAVNDFIMKEWQLLSTRDPASRVWRHDPAVVRPSGVFAGPNRTAPMPGRS